MRSLPRLIRSRDNAQVKKLLKLASSTGRRRADGVILLEGAHLLEAFRRTRGSAVMLASSEEAYADPRMRELLDSIPAATRVLLSDSLIARVSQVVTSSGVLAVVPTPGCGPEPAHVGDGVMLDGIQDPGNLGSMLRSAAAAGVSRVFLSPGCVFAWSPKVLRAGQGAHFALSIHENADLAKLARRAKGKVVATDPRASGTLFDVDLRGPVAWLFGNEGAGLTAAPIASATERVCIPMPGGAESLNVAAAAAVCLFEQVRQRRNAGLPVTSAAA